MGGPSPSLLAWPDWSASMVSRPRGERCIRRLACAVVSGYNKIWVADDSEGKPRETAAELCSSRDDGQQARI